MVVRTAPGGTGGGAGHHGHSRGGPADRAGVRPDDMITAAAGEVVRDPTDLLAVVDRVGVGGNLKLQFRRGEQQRELSLRPVDRSPLQGQDLLLPAP